MSSGHKRMGIPPLEPAYRDESNGRGRMGIPPFDSSRRAGSNGGIFIRLRLLDAEIFDETSNGAVPKVIKMPICQLSQHPVIVEEWEYHHSTRLNEPVRMVVFLSFYDHWI